MVLQVSGTVNHVTGKNPLERSLGGFSSFCGGISPRKTPQILIYCLIASIETFFHVVHWQSIVYKKLLSSVEIFTTYLPICLGLHAASQCRSSSTRPLSLLKEANLSSMKSPLRCYLPNKTETRKKGKGKWIRYTNLVFLALFAILATFWHFLSWKWPTCPQWSHLYDVIFQIKLKREKIGGGNDLHHL